MSPDQPLFRVDAHQRFTPEHPAEHFAPILKRNRFAGSVAIVSEADSLSVADHDFVLAIVVAGEPGPWRLHPKFRGVVRSEPAGEIRPGDTLDLLVRAPELAPVVRFAQEHPKTRIALDHLGQPDIASGEFPAWSASIDRLAELPNVYCKLSALVRVAPAPWKADALRPYVHHAIRRFGPDRVMFGSGWPDCLPEYAWKETLAAFTQSLGAAPIPVREQLLGGTARRFYSID